MVLTSVKLQHYYILYVLSLVVYNQRSTRVFSINDPMLNSSVNILNSNVIALVMVGVIYGLALLMIQHSWIHIIIILDGVTI